MLKYFVYIIIILIQIPLLFSQIKNGIEYRTLPESKLWIEGTSTIVDFTCITNSIDGYAFIKNDNLTKEGNGNQKFESKVVVSIVVKSLDCGNEMMNEDMYEAMKDKKNPFILYELLNSKIVSEEEISGWSEIQTTGYLTIAGYKRIVNIPLKVRKLPDGKYNLVGIKELSMHDFNIEPPSAFFGLIEADDKLVIKFNLIAGISQDINAAEMNIKLGEDYFFKFLTIFL